MKKSSIIEAKSSKRLVHQSGSILGFFKKRKGNVFIKFAKEVGDKHSL